MCDSHAYEVSALDKCSPAAMHARRLLQDLVVQNQICLTDAMGSFA